MLPKPRAAEHGVAHEQLSGLERTIALVWCAAVRRERVALDEPFFSIGGDSLIVVEVHQKLRRELGHEFPITVLFEYVTLRTLAAELERRLSGGAVGADQGVARGAGVSRLGRQRDARRLEPSGGTRR
jgi:acyl carrier protein